MKYVLPIMALLGIFVFLAAFPYFPQFLLDPIRIQTIGLLVFSLAAVIFWRFAIR